MTDDLGHFSFLAESLGKTGKGGKNWQNHRGTADYSNKP
jgi:hypothetical protein